MDSTDQGSARRFDGPTRSVLVAIGLTVAGLVATQIGQLPAALVDPSLLEDPQQVSREGYLTSFALGYVGMALVGVAYLAYSDRGRYFLDVGIPSLGDWKYAILGVLGALGVALGVSFLGQALGVPSANHQVVDIVGTDSTLVLYLIAMVFLFNAPAEEFLFRNIIQKRLYTAFTRMQAVVVSSVIFALVHIPVYAVAAETTAGVGISLLSLFGGSIVFGWTFVRTENLVVPTLAHAGLNSFTFINLYVLIEHFPEEYESMAMVLGSVPF